MTKKNYHPEEYWSDVGELITQRGGGNVIAGDDEPYYRYKREVFLNLLRKVDLSEKKVLEVGCGPGGNLLELLKLNPKKLVGADISQVMVNLAKQNLSNKVEIVKTNGTSLPFEDKSFDVVITATVLQHNTDEQMLALLIDEIGRVSGDRVVIFEKIDDQITGDELCKGRPVTHYSQLFEKSGFKLVDVTYSNIRVSYYVCGFIRKVFNRSDRKEGEPLNGFSIAMQNLILLITKPLDKIFSSKKDLARLTFQRK